MNITRIDSFATILGVLRHVRRLLLLVRARSAIVPRLVNRLIGSGIRRSALGRKRRRSRSSL